MYAPNRTPVNGAHFPWYVALDLPGASQMKYLRTLIESRPVFDRIPDQSIVDDAYGNNDHVQACRGEDYIFIYTAEGNSISVNADKISGNEVVAHWYNPKNGEVKSAGKFKKENGLKFTSPSSGYGQDWVLIVDDVSKAFALPGKTDANKEPTGN
jgi:hypothetical protein